MAYASLAQIRTAAGGADKLVQLADQDEDGVADGDVIAQAQAEADGWIDSYVAKRYGVPLPAPSLALQACSASEVVYWLRSKRSMTTQQDVDAKTDRMKWLEAIAKGHVKPSDPPPPAASTSVSAWVDRDECAPGALTRGNTEGAW